MPFQPKKTRNKVASGYHSIYLTDTLRERIEQLAGQNNTSFNNVVISMIEYCLDELDEQERAQADAEQQ